MTDMFGNLMNVLFDVLTLHAQRYLVQTPSTGDLGLSRLPMIFLKTVDTRNVNFGRPLGLSIRGNKLIELIVL